MPLVALLWCVAALLATAVLAVVIGRSPRATPIVYGATLAISAVALLTALVHLLANAEALSVTLPLGLPWVGSHFRLDALSAFFLAVVDLGGAAASLYALTWHAIDECGGKLDCAATSVAPGNWREAAATPFKRPKKNRKASTDSVTLTTASVPKHRKRQPVSYGIRT